MSYANTEAMREVIRRFKNHSVSSSSCGSVPCTVDDLKKLRNEIAKTLDELIDHLD